MIDERYKKAEDILNDKLPDILEILGSEQIKNPQEFLEKTKDAIITMKNVIIVQGVILLEQNDKIKKFNQEAKKEKIQSLVQLESWEKILTNLDEALQKLNICNAVLEKRKLIIQKELKVH